jgi:hypothetical protein
MKCTLAVNEQYTAALLIFMSLGAYGCTDSATVSEPAELGNLSVSTGTLQPPFNPATSAYTVQLSSDVSSTTITASPRVDGDTIRIDNQPTTSQTVTLDSPGAEKSVSIVVTETGTGGSSKSYTVRVERDLEDNSLEALSVSSGTLAPSPFDKNVLDYTVNNVGTSVTSVTISATKSDLNSAMQIGSVTVPAGTASGQAAVQLGSTGSATLVSIDITRPGGNKKTYTVTINRGPSGNNNLGGLTISSGTLNFRASTTSYTVNVASNVTSVTVRPTLADTTSNMTVNGQVTNSGQAQTIRLNEPAGSNTVINILVIAQNGIPKSYSVNVVRTALSGNINLRGLAVSQGTLDPDFDANTTSYTVKVGSGVSNIAITPTLQDTTATMTVNGQAATSGQDRVISLRDAGLTPINIVVRAPNGSQNTYLITVDRLAPPPPSGNNNLSALTVSPGSLSQSFSPGRTSYTVNVDSGVGSVTVTATKADSNAVISGDLPNEGQATIQLDGAPSRKDISIIVTAPNQTSMTYTIAIERAAQASNNNLQSLSVSPGPLTPAFTTTITSYTVNVSSSITSVTITASPQDTNASMEVNGQGTSSGQAREISLGDQGSSTDITIRVTPPNGTAKIYTIAVKGASNGDDENNGGKGKKGGNGNTKGKGNKGNDEGNRDDGGDDED